MLETIVTVALVSVFFGALAVVIPKNLQAYVAQRRLTRAVEMTQIIENGLALEFGAASNILVVDDDESGIDYISYQVIAMDEDGNSVTNQHWFPANYKSGQVSTNADVSGTAKNVNSQGEEFTLGAKSLEADGKPQIFNFVIDDEFYKDMNADITVYYNEAKSLMSVKVRIYDDEDICVTEKAIVMYN